MKFRILLMSITVCLLTIVLLFSIQKVNKLNILFLTGNDTFDSSALNSFKQSLEANINVTMRKLSQYPQLEDYDAIYLDPNLSHSPELNAKLDDLIHYVREGGNLYLENIFYQDFPKRVPLCIAI